MYGLTQCLPAQMPAPPVKAHGGFQLPDELKPANALLELWAEQTADGHPLQANAIARAIAEAEGAALPGGSPVLSDDVALVDRIIARAPRKTQRVIYIHYRSWTTSDVKARRLARELSLPNVSRATWYTEVKSALWYVTGALQFVRELDLRPV